MQSWPAAISYNADRHALAVGGGEFAPVERAAVEYTVMTWARAGQPAAWARVAVRDSKDPAGPALVVSRRARRSFTEDLKAGAAGWG